MARFKNINQNNNSINDIILGQDENQTFCRQCPRERGHPLGKSKYATLSCKHRYTKNWICSVPCDGIDDLCEDFEDENCLPDSKQFTLITVFAYPCVSSGPHIESVAILRRHTGL